MLMLAKFTMLLYYSIVMKGNTHNLMKACAKRRRTKAEIEADKMAEKDEKARIEESLAELEGLKEQMK